MLYSNENRELWEERYTRIDKVVTDYVTLQGWDSFVPECDSVLFKAFCRHFMYVITSFLEERETRELFIKIPVNEFSNIGEQGGNDLRLIRWQNAINAATACLSLATSRKTKENAFPAMGQYRDRDLYLYFNNNNKPRLCRYNSRTQRMEGDANAVTAFHNSPVSLRVRHDYVVNARNTEGALLEVFNLRKTIQAESSSCYPQFNSAALIVSGVCRPSTQMVVWESRMIDVPITISTNAQNASQTNPEIIIALGDDKYLRCYNRYRNSAARKIIYVGTDIPYDNVPTYAFTFQEIYRYCRTAEDSFFCAPLFIPLRFGWLEECRRQLMNILDRCKVSDPALTDDIIHTAVIKLLRPFCNMNFNADKLNDLKERISESLDDIFPFDVDISTLESVLDWYGTLTFDGINPKREYVIRNQPDLAIARFDSYKRRVQELSGDGNRIIVDNLACHQYDDRYEYILCNLLFANIVSVYYEGFEDTSRQTVERFLSNESSRLSRRQYGTNADVPLANYDNNADYDNYFEEEYRLSSIVYEAGDTVSYRVTFTDRTCENIDGDILIDFGSGFERMNISSLYEQENYQRPVIYYRPPERYDNLMRIGLDIPTEVMGRVDDYARLWKERYRTVFDKYNRGVPTIKATINLLFDKCIISKNSLRKYSKSDVPHRFLKKRDMLTMCDFLIAEGVISEIEKNRILKAKELIEDRKSFGRSLKDIVLSLYMHEEITDEEKRRICGRLLRSFNEEELQEMVLVSGKVIHRITQNQ